MNQNFDNNEQKLKSKQFNPIEKDTLDDLLTSIRCSKNDLKIKNCILWMLLISAMMFCIPLWIYCFNKDMIVSLVIFIVLFFINSFLVLINKKTNSSIIRIISTIFILASLLFLQNNDMALIDSCIFISILILISIFNFYNESTNWKFLIGFSIINYCSFLALIKCNFINETALFIYVVFLVIANCLVYKLFRANSNSKLWTILLFLINANTIEKFINHSDNMFLKIIYLVSFSIIIFTFYYSVKDNRLKMIYYSYYLYILCGVLSVFESNRSIVTIITYILTISSIYALINFSNIFMRLYSMFFLLLGYMNFLSADSILEFIIYFIIFGCSIWIVCKEKKDSKLVIVFKNGLFITTIISILTNLQYNSYIIYMATYLCVLYVFALTNINRLRDKYFKTTNKYILIISFIISNIFGIISVENLILSFIISTIILLLFTNDKYVSSIYIKKYIHSIYSILLTYWTYRFCILALPYYEISNIVSSLLLIILSFMFIAKGIKINVKELKNYGLLLLILCSIKLLIFDLCFSTITIRFMFLIFILIPIMLYSLINHIKNKNTIDNKSKELDDENKEK